MSEENSEAAVIKHWLKAQLIPLMNVQNCTVTPGKTVIVQTWTGVIINIHLIDAPARTRTIKSILQESTALGIGVMFLVKADLLPQPDARFEAKEWLLAVHAVHHERLYAYRIGAGGPQLAQAHFEPIGTTGEWVAKYGPPVQIEQLRYLRTSVRPRYIRGDWQIADFGLNTFWKDPYTVRRAEYRRPENRDTTWRAWSQNAWDQRPHSEEIPAPDLPRPARSRLELCYELLEVRHDAPLEEVKAAFRRRALALHPDTSALPKEEAASQFQALNEAYEFIKAQNKWS